MDLEKREWLSIITAALLMTIIIVFAGTVLSLNAVLEALLVSIIIMGLSVFAKKYVSYNLDIETRIKGWEFKRYGIAAKHYFKKAFPIGLILPLIIAIASKGTLKFFAFLQFDAKALPSKAVKKYGIKRFSGIMEWDDALIVFYSALPILVLAMISSFFSLVFMQNLARYSLIYVVSNIIPLGQLDGTKLFFGSRPLFAFTWLLTIIAAFTIAL